jgi:hypothetical protein
MAAGEEYRDHRISLGNREAPRGLTMLPVHRFSPTRRANLIRAIQALFPARRLAWNWSITIGPLIRGL